ncbi:hypothetical protein HNV10_16550 [Winogradskyella litoriviva]|uniref:Uncharacterized protein n=1 Tax=Winogradskyella litoriviva TaxID=1220182 RepID=A0ABX2EBM5_9FLAO|nr:hypothetical protein [Winogradskyella litoriviva]NRD24866.1 hypothetical protein [Winogradskyella litoriviva]
MKKGLKHRLLIFGIVIITVVGFIGFGLYSMEIEDHYGDLKELYYDSKSGDIILNKSTSEFGIIEKNWKRINIRTRKKDSTDLYNWVYQNGIETNTEIYRPIIETENINSFDYSEVVDKINASEMTFINRNKKE